MTQLASDRVSIGWRFGALSLILALAAVAWFLFTLYGRVRNATSGPELALAMWWMVYPSASLVALGLISAAVGLSRWSRDRPFALAGFILNGGFLTYLGRLIHRGLW